MTDERRERYAMAIMNAGGAAYPLDYYAVEAPAVMAVADAEIAERLRAEAAALTRAGFPQAAGFLAGGIND